MMENIKDLNVLAGEGISRIQRTTDGARLKVRTFKMKISQLPSMICYRYIFIKSQKFLFSSFAQVNFHLMMPTSELLHTFYTITRQFQMSCYKVALGVWFGEFWMCGKVYVTSNLVSTPASVFPQQIQTKFIHKLYMNMKESLKMFLAHWQSSFPTDSNQIYTEAPIRTISQLSSKTIILLSSFL